MRTLLEAKHFSKEGKLLPDSYKGWSKSFTKHFIECLYLSHANILQAAPYTLADVIGSTSRNVDCDSFGGALGKTFPKANMQLAGPAGLGIVNLPMGDTYSSSTNAGSYLIGTAMPGHAIGIQIGRSNTAVTPTDAFLNDRIAHGRNAAVGASIIDSVLTGDLNDSSQQLTNAFLGFLYRPLRSCSVSDIQIKVWRTGSPGNVNLIIVGVNFTYNSQQQFQTDATIIATSNAVNANLWGAASPGAMQTFTFGSPPTLQAGFTYFIAISPSQVSGGNYVVMRTGTPNLSRIPWAYAGITLGSGNITGVFGSSPIVQIDGTAGNEMEYGATDIYGYTVSNPTASFTLRRIFMNNSGNAITVQESGIYLPVTRYSINTVAYDYSNFIVCAAHGVFAGITVNNGESLEIDYTPSIQV